MSDMLAMSKMITAIIFEYQFVHNRLNLYFGGGAVSDERQDPHNE